MLPTVKHKTREIALKRPETLLPGLFGLGSLILGLMISSAGLKIVGVGAFLFAILMWTVNSFLRSDQMLSLYFKQREKQFERENNLKLKNLKSVFLQGQLVREARSYGQQGYEQFELIEKKFNSIEKILGQKFNPGELTHRKFLSTAEEINNAILDNLTQAAEILESVIAIDSDYIQKRMEKLKNISELTEPDQNELSTLEKRMQVQQEQFSKISEILSLNEQAMTKLDEARSAIVSVQTQKGAASQDLKQTMQQLEQIIQSAEKYRINKR